MTQDHRVAIVTGGGRGIGQVIAPRLARGGTTSSWPASSPTSCARPPPKSNAWAGTLAVVADVARDDQVQTLVERSRVALGPIDILVNNAAIIGPTASVERVLRADWDEVLAVNLTGAWLCRGAVLPEMIARCAGKIINIASMAGKIAYPLRSPYAVSKWGLIGLTLTLAQEVGAYGIQVNAVCPGPVEGERMRRIIADRAEALSQAPEQVERDVRRARGDEADGPRRGCGRAGRLSRLARDRQHHRPGDRRLGRLPVVRKHPDS